MYCVFVLQVGARLGYHDHLHNLWDLWVHLKWRNRKVGKPIGKRTDSICFVIPTKRKDHI